MSLLADIAAPPNGMPLSRGGRISASN